MVGIQGQAIPASDQEITDVFDSPDRFISVKQRRDFSLEQAPHGTVAGYDAISRIHYRIIYEPMFCNQPQAKIHGIEIIDFIDFVNPEDRRFPDIDVIYFDQTGVAINGYIFPLPSRI